MSGRPRLHASCTRHRGYLLSCGQFDGLADRAYGFCEICCAPEATSAHGVLHIDHDADVGQWAVRGLLCDGCNIQLRPDRRLWGTPGAQRYRANAWYLQALAGAGITAALPPEPEIGIRLFVDGCRCIHVAEGVWRKDLGANSVETTWRGLWYRYGPLKITVRPAGALVATVLADRAAS